MHALVLFTLQESIAMLVLRSLAVVSFFCCVSEFYNFIMNWFYSGRCNTQKYVSDFIKNTTQV